MIPVSNKCCFCTFFKYNNEESNYHYISVVMKNHLYFVCTQGANCRENCTYKTYRFSEITAPPAVPYWDSQLILTDTMRCCKLLIVMSFCIQRASFVLAFDIYSLKCLIKMLHLQKKSY